MGVSQSIADGYMGRCEMVWTTAGTNRVCGRCLELKDKVVGYTDESGVTIPPLHPRCRCAIMYREVGAPRAMQPKPQFVIAQYEDVARIHSHEEVLRFANQIKPTIERYTGRQSKWNGKIILQDEGEVSGGKLWDCSIRLNSDAPEHVLIHELVHSCSISHYNSSVFFANRFEEELTVEYLSQELAILENVPVVNSGYTTGVELIRELKLALGISVSDLEFASELIKQALGERWDWLWEQISNKMNSEAPVEFGQELMNKLERIRNWEMKKSSE